MQCKKDIQLKIRSGGDILYDPSTSSPTCDVLLIAGGIGINPILSILRHIVDLKQQEGGNSYISGKTLILYSAESLEELVFKVIVECDQYIDTKEACVSGHVLCPIHCPTFLLNFSFIFKKNV